MPLMSTFLQGRCTFLSCSAPVFDIVHIRLMELNGQPVPGVPDIDLDLRFICPDTLIHISTVHAWIDISGFWERRLPATVLQVFVFPVGKIALIRGNFPSRLIDRTAAQIARQLVELLIELRVFYIRMSVGDVDQCFYIKEADSSTSSSAY